jgi:hypothetical protein
MVARPISCELALGQPQDEKVVAQQLTVRTYNAIKGALNGLRVRR